VAAGFGSSFVGIVLSNPADLIKIRLQSQNVTLPATMRYRGTIDAFAKIVKGSSGHAGLWRGIVPNIMRNSIINVTELVTYDVVKTNLLKSRDLALKDTISTHVLAGSTAGVAAAATASPLDVVKSRVMNMTRDPKTNVRLFDNSFDCLVKTLHREGPGALYKGFGAMCCRMCTFNVLMFVTFEQIKRFFYQHDAKNQY
jgi:solute carrier family 25 uncoupling protein 8/9